MKYDIQVNCFFICFLVINHLNFGIDTKPTKAPEIGKQCSEETSPAECPRDNCNNGYCERGCASGACTWKDCDDIKKAENRLCYVTTNNCQKGLKCMKQDDGCDNGIGRCVKSGK